MHPAYDWTNLDNSLRARLRPQRPTPTHPTRNYYSTRSYVHSGWNRRQHNQEILVRRLLELQISPLDPNDGSRTLDGKTLDLETHTKFEWDSRDFFSDGWLARARTETTLMREWDNVWARQEKEKSGDVTVDDDDVEHVVPVEEGKKRVRFALQGTETEVKNFYAPEEIEEGKKLKGRRSKNETPAKEPRRWPLGSRPNERQPASVEEGKGNYKPPTVAEEDSEEEL